MNLCIFSGHLGKDAEFKNLDGGRTVANFSIALGETWKDKDGNKKERTDWADIAAWGKSAEIAEKYFKKGTGLTVVCKYRKEKYEKDGVTHYSTKFEMQSFEFLPKGSGSGEQSAPAEQAPAANYQPAPDNSPAPWENPAKQSDDSDLPF